MYQELSSGENGCFLSALRKVGSPMTEQLQCPQETSHRYANRLFRSTVCSIQIRWRKNPAYDFHSLHLHASTETNKSKNQISSFPHKDKINYIYTFKAKLFSWFLFILPSMSIDHKALSTLSMIEHSTVTQIKIVNSNVYSYTVCRVQLKLSKF